MQRWLETVVRFLRMVLGQWSFSFSWRKPEWMGKAWRKLANTRFGQKVGALYQKSSQWVNRKLITPIKEKIRSNPQRAKKWALITAGTFVVLASSAYGLKWYLDSLPKPDYITFRANAPYPTDVELKTVHDLTVTFSKSAAPMDQIGKVIKDAAWIKPKMAGTWKWSNDRTLVFTPKDVVAFKTDWLVGTEYELELNKKIFPSHLIFETYEAKFKTSDLKTYVGDREFYIDPTNNKIRKATFTIRSSVPFNPEDFKKRLHLKIRNQGAGESSDSTIPAQITFNSYSTEAYVQTEPLKMENQDRLVSVVMDKGLKSQRGGEDSVYTFTEYVDIPGRFSAFKISTPQIIFARNDKFEPEQVLVFETGVGVKTEEIAKTLKVYLLPAKHDVKNESGKWVKSDKWNSHAEVNPTMRSEMQAVEISPIPTEEPYSASHSFKLKVPVQRYLYFELPPGVKASGDFELGKKFESIVYSPIYGSELMFMSEGSLLTLSGDRKLPLLARNVQAVEFEVGRIIANKTNFLISRMFNGNSFSDPEFYGDVEDMIVERAKEKQKIPKADDAKTQYFSLDMKAFNQGQPGFYYVRVHATQKTPMGERDRPESHSSHDEEGEGEYDGESEGESRYSRPSFEGKSEDRRLILITDLGLIAKHTSSGNMIVYVQNLRTGNPVENATVDVIGVNGMTIVSQNSDGQGRVNFPSLSNYTREKKPLAIVAHHGQDMSYLPYKLSQRQLQYSRFDIGGEYEKDKSDQLAAMLFSDRGIYRPGDSVNIGMIMRSKGAVKDVESLPMVVSVIDPRGTKIKIEKMPLKLFSLQDFNFSTLETSPAGTYSIQLHVIRKRNTSTYEQLIGSTEVQVEEFVPDKLKILAQLSPSKAKGWVPLEKVTARVSLKNLFGAAAENRTVRSKVTIIPVSPSTEKFKDFTFTNPNRDKQQTATEELPEKTTDTKGEASYDIDLKKYSGYFAIRFHTEGFEAGGGRSVEALSSTMASQWKFLVGYKADGSLSYITKGGVRKLNLLALGPDMTPVTGKVKMVLNEVKHVSTLVKQKDNNYRYQSIKKEVPVKSEDVTVSENGLVMSLPTDNAGSFVYIVQNSEGDEVNRVNFTVIGEANLTRSLDRNAELQIVLNKEDYKPGEEIEMQILAPYAGNGLITIEREGVFAQKWFKTQSNSTVERIRLPENLTGNAYVNVTFLRAVDSKEIYMSPLSYGVQPFSISLDSQRTKVNLKTPEKVKPGQTISIKYSSNRPTSLILYGVDEGILQVAKYKLPNPLLHFFKKRTLQVETYQLLDLLMPEYSLIANSSTPGGDESEQALEGNLNPFKAKNLKPVVFWSGVLNADENEKTFNYTVPEYFNGNIKVMAVASAKGGLGSTETGTISRGDFIITPTAPIFVTPSDEIEMGVSISNQSENPKSSSKVKVTATTSPHLTIVGASEQTLEIPVGRETATSFKMKANNKYGAADLKLVAGNGTESATFSHQVSVRPAVPYLTSMTGGFEEDLPIEVKVDRDLSPELAKQNFSLSPLPYAITEGLATYLNDFPYGCTEQMVSQAIPSLILTGKLAPAGGAQRAQSAHDQLLTVLRRRQTSDGGFKLYEEGNTANHPATIYAISYLVEAKDRQLPIPSDMETQILGYLRSRQLRSDADYYDLRAYAQVMYLQARMGIVPGNSLNYLVENLEKNHKGKWEQEDVAMYLAGTYQLLKQDAKGWGLLKSLKLGDAKQTNYLHYYDPLVRDTTLIKIVARHYPTRLVDFITKESWKILATPVKAQRYNTVSAAQLIMAFAVMSTAAERADFPGGLVLKELTAAGEKELNLPKEIVSRASVSIGAKKVTLGGSGYTPLFYSFTQKGFDRELPKTETKKGMEITRVFEDKDGKSISKVKMGDEVNVVLRWRTLEKNYVPYVVMVDLFPAGFELLRDSVNAGSLEFIDKREDRMVLYTSATETMGELRYRLKATHKGKFNLPPTFGGSMYDDNFQYRGVSAGIEVF